MPLPSRPYLLLFPAVAISTFLAVPVSAPVAVYAQADRAQGEMVKLTFPNADVRDVLSQYELLVGKRLIYDNTVQGQVNINVPEVPKEEAIRIIEITLLMNGYHLVPSDTDPNLIKATGVGRSPRQVGVPILAEPEPIPDNEQVIMYLVKLRYADPTEMAQVLQQAMPPSRQEYAPNIVPLPKAQALIITENTAILRGLMRIIRAADLEPTRVEGEFIALQRASAKDVVQMLEKLFEKTQTPQSAPSAPRPAAPPQPGAQPGAAPAPVSQLTTVEIGGMNEDSMLAGKVRLTADERTNRIYVVSRPVNLPILRKLIEDFDRDVPFSEPMVRPLKFVSAGDILDALVKAVSDPGSKDAGATGATGSTGTPQNRTPTPAANNNSQFGNQLGARGLNGVSSSASPLSLQTEPHEIVPQTVMVGNSRIMADKRSNAILVIGSTDIKDRVGKILDQLDVRTPQVMLTTVIGELTLSQDEEFGVNYLLHKGRRDLVTGGSSNASLLTGGGPFNNSMQQLAAAPNFTRVFAGGAGGMTGFISAGDTLSAIVTALESTSKFKVTSRPSLFTSNNKKASIVSGEKIAVITGSQSSPTTTGNSVVNQVQYIPVNLSLEVVPLINSDKEVYLDVVQSLDEITGSTPIKDSNGVNDYPIIANRQLQTSVMVPNDGTLVLGGLIKDTRKKVNSGIPVLGRIPLLGGLFRSTSDIKTRTELLVLIRPSVSMDPTEGYDVRDRNLKAFRIPRTLEEELIAPELPAKKGEPKPPTKSFRADPAAVQQGGDSSKAATSEPVTIPVVTPVEPPASPKGKAAKAQTKPSAS